MSTIEMWAGTARIPDGTKRIADNALAAMTFLMAESRPQDKDILAGVTVNLINKRNL